MTTRNKEDVVFKVTSCQPPAALLMLLLCIFAVSGPVRGQQNETSPSEEKDVEVVKKTQSAPQDLILTGKIPVMVVHKGMDSLGRRVVFNLRERFNSSELFRLSGYKEKKIKLIISSQEEFRDRPGLSSIYSMVWTYSYGEDVLSNYLQSEVGIISANAISDLAETLAARTDEIYYNYSYLFEEEP
jgi:hypothetical protein